MAKQFDTLTSFVSASLGVANTGVFGRLNPAYDYTALYREAWLPRKIVDIPAFDMIREWRDWKAEQDQIETIEEEEKRLNVQAILLEGIKAARLRGGAAIYIGTKDTDLSLPLDLNRIGLGGVTYLAVVAREDLNTGDRVDDPADILYGKPGWYELGEKRTRIHPTRLVILVGNAIPMSRDPWGESVLVPVLRAIGNADDTSSNIAALVFEAKVDVFRIKNLMENLSRPEYEERLLRRLGLANMGKGGTGALVMDFEEEYTQKTASFGQLPELMINFYQVVSGAADIPMTRLMGMSPAGMNATGESDLRNYYDRIASDRNLTLGPAIRNLDECIIRSALGDRPEEIWYEWGSLWQLSDKEKAEISKMASETIVNLNNTGLWTPDALAVASTNMLSELGTLPGLQEAIDQSGGPPDFEADLKAEQDARLAATRPGNVVPLKRAADDDQL